MPNGIYRGLVDVRSMYACLHYACMSSRIMLGSGAKGIYTYMPPVKYIYICVYIHVYTICTPICIV